MISFALEMLKKEKKKGLYLIISLILFINVSLIIAQLLNNHSISKNVTLLDILLKRESYVVSCLVSILLFASIVLITYSLDYYLKSQESEFSFLILSGYRNSEIVRYECIKVGILILFSLFISIILGYIYMPFLVKGILNYAKMVNHTKFQLYLPFVFQIFIPILILFSLARISHFVEQAKLVDLINEKNESIKDHRLIKSADALYIIIYMIGIVCMFIDDDLSPSFAFASSIGSFGIYGIMLYVIPNIIDEMIHDLNLKPLTYLILGKVKFICKKTYLLNVFIALTLTFLTTFSFASLTPLAHILMHIGLVLLTVSLSCSLIFYFNLYDYKHRLDYLNLLKIGLTEKEVQLVRSKSIQYYFNIIYILNIIYFICISGIYYFVGHVGISLVIIIFLEAFLPFILVEIFLRIKVRRSLV